MKKALVATFVLLSFFNLSAHAGSLPVAQDKKTTAGLLLGFGSSEYNVDDKLSVMPLILYDNNRVYFEGSELGVYPYKDDKHWVRVGVNYDGRNFKPKNANTEELRQLDKRKTSVNATASYMYITPIGGLEVQAMTDILDRSSGQSVTLANRGRFVLADEKLTVYPKLGVEWHSKKYNQYYYGISQAESTRSGLSAYDAKDGFSPFLSVSAKYDLPKNLGIFANGRVNWLSSTQKNSPMTDDKTKATFNVGLTYDF